MTKQNPSDPVAPRLDEKRPIGRRHEQPLPQNPEIEVDAEGRVRGGSPPPTGDLSNRN